MASVPQFDCTGTTVPAGYMTIALSPEQREAPLRVAVLARKEPDSVGGSLVLLRDNLDGKVYLGAVQDAAGKVRQWVEIWVQTVAGIAGTAAAYRETLTNATLDARWSAFARSLGSLDTGGLLETGWESSHPPPLLLDLDKGQPLVPTDPAENAPWRLCEDDALLQLHGLPPYRTTLHRYLCIRHGQSGAVIFAPTTPEAPTNDHTIRTSQLPGYGQRVVPFNLEGGLLLVRPYYPLSLNDYVDVLSGAAWQGVLHGREHLDPEQAGTRLGHEDAPGRLFLAGQGRHGRLVEALHLKLCLLARLFRLTRDVVQQQQRPLLNLTADSFRVRCGGADETLPFLWTTQTTLTDAGDAAILPITDSETQYYFRARERDVSVYRPAAGVAARGRGVLRIRRVFDEPRRGAIVEGTFQPREDIAVDRHDLVWFRINLKDTAMDLYATLEQDRALAYGEWRFRTVGQRLGEPRKAELSAAEGAPLQNIPFEVFPFLSSPCDLYALAVIGVRTLLVNSRSRLAVALDELTSLAREAGKDGGGELSARLGERFAQDPRWAEALGPHRLLEAELSSAEAFAALPATVWWDTLAMLIRMLPGVSTHSTCRDYGDAPARALQDVFQRAVAEAERLVRLTRSLIVTDWQDNREVCGVLDALAAKLGTKVTGAARAP